MKMPLILFFIMQFTFCIAQLDTQKVAQNAKLWLVPELKYYYMTADDIIEFVQKPLKIEFIESKGFLDLIFFKIKHQEIGHCTQANGDTIYMDIPLPNTSADLIMAYCPSGKNLYSISGFKHSDIDFLLNSGTFLQDCEWWMRPYKCLWIEGVDMRKVIKNRCH